MFSALSNAQSLHFMSMKFDDNPDACYGREGRTNGGSELQAIRGEHFASVKIHWPGNSRKGFLVVGANFWQDIEGHTGNLIRQLGHFPEVCYSFGP
jgi:hypothetical protein